MRGDGPTLSRSRAAAGPRVWPRRRAATAAMLVTVCACPLAAQGVPQPPRPALARLAQPSDTIVRLAVDPTRITGNLVHFLLDEFRAQVERDGTGMRVRLDGTLRADGRMDLLLDEAPIGDAAWALRAAFATPLDSSRRATGLRGIANGYLPESTADSLVAFDGLDFSQDARLRAWLRDGRGARPAGPVWLLQLPSVVAWMRAVAADDLEFITLTPAP
jgi:hypothetical protein